MDRKKSVRMGCAVALAALMGAAAGVAGEREMLFPEAAALTVGLWIIDKPVWRVSRWHVVVLMSFGALAGIGLTNFSPLPLPCNLCLAFLFAATCLVVSRTTLVPLLSASLLPVLLDTRTWVYPVAVLGLTTLLVAGQWAMERIGLRRARTVADSFPGAERVVQEKDATVADADCRGLLGVGEADAGYAAETPSVCGRPDGMAIPKPRRNHPAEGREPLGDVMEPSCCGGFWHGPAGKAGQCATPVTPASGEGAATAGILLTPYARKSGQVPQTEPLSDDSPLGSDRPRGMQGPVKATGQAITLAISVFRERTASAGPLPASGGRGAETEPVPDIFRRAEAQAPACPPSAARNLQAEGRDSLPAPAHGSQELFIARWLAMTAVVGLVAWLADATRCPYLILPPLVVTFVEMVTSKAGFRTRPVQVFGLLTVAALLGTAFRLAMDHLGLPLPWAAAGSVMCLFGIFEGAGRYFAPAAAMALVPLLVPAAGIVWLPVQAAGGAALLIAVALVVFLRCGRWPRAQRWACFVPRPVRRRRRRGVKTSSGV